MEFAAITQQQVPDQGDITMLVHGNIPPGNADTAAQAAEWLTVAVAVAVAALADTHVGSLNSCHGRYVLHWLSKCYTCETQQMPGTMTTQPLARHRAVTGFELEFGGVVVCVLQALVCPVPQPWLCHLL